MLTVDDNEFTFAGNMTVDDKRIHFCRAIWDQGGSGR